jgi:hypothetical protein
VLINSLGEKRLIQITVILLWFFCKKSLSENVMQTALKLLNPRVRRDWNFCDELRELKENPGASFDSMLLKDLGLVPRNLMDYTHYEALFRRIWDTAGVDTPTKQYSDRTLRVIDGEKQRLTQFKHSRARE